MSADFIFSVLIIEVSKQFEKGIIALNMHEIFSWTLTNKQSIIERT